jgi:hypothetical protein
MDEIPACFINDELHIWDGNKWRPTQSLSKRTKGLEFLIKKLLRKHHGNDYTGPLDGE